ncbi:hypothetical protein, conserved [Leishmania donovani]|uniref:Uncharacterized protein n=1 Tax=Leishmania donovani TaxID=5661 RepID=E9BKR1_LEIDO|nr:hypothetical protein, conserved [Leishmania donovani]CBZ35839.1 hypothetical protein, conserved [Leishmania donovani]
MHEPRAPNAHTRAASPPPASPHPLPLLPAVFTAQQAEESVELIQRELSRLLRACEYREQHPYSVFKGRGDSSRGAATPRSTGSSNGTSSRSASALASHRRDPTASLLSDADPSLQLAQPTTAFSSFPLGPHGSDAAEAAFFSVAGTSAAANAAPAVANLSGASFSAFERRRIAHLLGRVALEIAAVWTYVRRNEPLCGTSPGDPTAPVSSVRTTHGTARPSSDRSTAAPAASPLAPASLNADGGDGRAAMTVKVTSEEPGAPTPAVLQNSVLGEATEERQDACDGDPVPQITALSALIEAAAAIQRALEMADGGGGVDHAASAERAGAAAACSVSANTLLGAAQAAALTFSSFPLDGVRAPTQEAAGVGAGKQSCRGSAVVDTSSDVAGASQAPPSALTGGRTSAREAAEQHSGEGESKPLAMPNATVARQAPSGSSPVKRGSTASSSIPSYLRAYVFEEGADGCADEMDNFGEGNGVSGNQGARAVLANADKSVSRSISVGSANARSLSRASELPATSHDDGYKTRPSSARSAVEHPARASHLSPAATVTRPSLLGSAGVSLTAPTHAGGSGGGATLVAALVDADPVSHSSSLRIQRALSALSLQSASFVSSPLQEPQLSTQQSQVCSGGSASSHPNASVSQRSPDSAEMSSAAAAAYLRSTSLFRRPHRLEVPVSRTQSLRRATSISSPMSVEGISLGSAPGAVYYNGMPSMASGACGNSSAASFHMTKSNSGLQLSSGGVGILRTSSGFNSFLPVAMGASTTVDSLHSSVAGLHFKRVISVDSEGELWRQGSLADSLEMSPQKVTPLLGRPSASAMEATLSSSPLSQDAGLATATGSHSDRHGALKSPLEGQSGGVVPVATSLSGHRSSALPPGRTELSRNRNALSRRGTPKPTVSSASAVAVPSAVLGSSSSQQRPVALLSPVHFSSSPQRRTHRSVAVPTVFAPAPGAAGGGLAADGLTPCLYHVEDEILKEFLRCVHDLTRTSLTDAEFDSLKLCYFLPGVSLVTSTGTARPPSSSPPPTAPPLPLFEGGELVPLHRGSLDVFCSLIRERLVAVCRSLRISTAPYLALL